MYNLTGGNQLLDVNLILERAHIREGMRVADFGCGATGHFVFPAANLVGEKGQVYAVDILKKVLETIERRIRQENTRNVQAVWSDMEVFGATKIETESLDIGLLVNTLFQSRKRVNIIREAVRMLKKKGTLVVVDWKNKALPFGPPTEERVDKEVLKKAAPKLGLEYEDEFFAGSYHYGLIFHKL